jgi:hypothetical protein
MHVTMIHLVAPRAAERPRTSRQRRAWRYRLIRTPANRGMLRAMAHVCKHESPADKVWFRPECASDSHVLHVRRCVYYPTQHVLSIENRSPRVFILTCCKDRLRLGVSRSFATEECGASALGGGYVGSMTPSGPPIRQPGKRPPYHRGPAG